MAAGTAAAASVKLAMDFDQSMTRISTMANVPKAQIKGLSDGVLNLAGQVGFSPNSLAQALYMVESSFQSMHLKGFNALDALRVAAEGAQIGGSDLLTTTQAMDALLASGMVNVNNYAGAMTAMTATVGSGEMTMQDYVDSLNGMQAIGKEFGVNMADMSAALATFGDNNIRGAQAGTTFRMVVQALSSPLKAGKEMLDDIGVGADGLAKDMQEGGLNKAIQDLNSHLTAAGITGSQVGEFLTKAFGKRGPVIGIGDILGELDRFNSKYKDYTALVGDKNSLANKWAQQEQLFSQQLKQVEAGAEAIGIRIGNFLIPKIMQFGKAVGDAWHNLNQQAGGQQSILKEFLTGFNNPHMTNFDSGFGGSLEKIGVAAHKLGDEAHKLWNEIYTNLKPVFHDVWDFITNSLLPAMGNLWTAFSPTVHRAIHDLGKAFSDLGGFIKNDAGPWLKDITKWMADHKQVIHDFADVTVVLFTAWAGYTVWNKANAAAQTLTGSIEALKTAAATPGGKVAFLVGISAGLYYLYKDVDTFRHGLEGFAGDLIGWGDAVLVAFKAVGDGVMSTMSSVVHLLALIPGPQQGYFKGLRKDVDDMKHTFDSRMEGAIKDTDSLKNHMYDLSKGIHDGTTTNITDLGALRKSVEGLPNKTIVVNVIDNASKILGDIHTAAAGLINMGFTPQEATNTIKASNYASGGRVSGPGGPREDRVPIMASNGEFVVNAAATSRNLGLLHAINGNGFADGGLVYDVTPTVRDMGAVLSGLSGGGVGGSAGAWAGPALQVLGMLGLSAALLPKVLRQINTESGGNPNAINLTDSNARAGHPSMGLMQTIMGTFLAYAGPFARLGPFNGFADLYAGVNYAAHRYGSNLNGLGEGHGYAMGGFARGWAKVGEAGPEMVYLGRGGQIVSNRDSTRGGGQVIVNLHGPVYSDSAGIKRLMTEIDREVSRGGSVPATFRR